MNRATLIFTLLFCIARCSTGFAQISNFAFAPHPGWQLPLATELTDPHGRQVPLGSFFKKSPVIVVLEYLHCRSLCGVTLRDVILTLRALPLKPGRDFELVAISIDPRDTPADAAAAQAKYASLYGGARIPGLHFLTGTAAAVGSIAERIGFPYRYERKLDTYIHPAGFAIASPDGVISSYVEGVDTTPATLVKALGDAEQAKRIGLLTRIVLLCHIEGTPLGRLTVPVLAAFTIADVAAGISLVALFVTIRSRRHG